MGLLESGSTFQISLIIEYGVIEQNESDIRIENNEHKLTGTPKGVA